jgi:hypothetical protein
MGKPAGTVNDPAATESAEVMVVSGRERLAKLLQEAALAEAGLNAAIVTKVAKSATPAR